MRRYNPKEIEPKWQKIWEESGTYTANLGSSKPKYIAMSMFNYPSGAGIHIGHAMNYTISDVKARFKRQQGYESYHPVGWDAFGLPAENYAIKAGVSPQESMAEIIPSYHKQYKAMGWSNDWEKEISTHLPEYYKWTQWIFSQMYAHGLAYQDARMQWWCSSCQTVLANEQVIDGRCWRHDSSNDPLVEKKEVKQWFFRITEYADELLEATDDLEWTDSVKVAQKKWIGKSAGAEISFQLPTQESFVLLHGYAGSPDTDFHPWLSGMLLQAGARNVSVPKLKDTNHPDAKVQAEEVLSEATFDSKTVLVGHSYGTVTALRILESLNEPIKKLVIVAGFAQPGFLDTKRPFEDTTDWKFDFDKIRRMAEEIVVLRPTHDTAVPADRSEFLARHLGVSVVDFDPSEDHACGRVETAILEYCSPSIKAFTTRPDTLFGATYMVLAPEHPLVDSLTTEGQAAEVTAYVKSAQIKSDVERQAAKDKTGVFTGSYAINPVTKEQIPVWIADYVLKDYGTGAIMAVPAHDERDFAFANKFNLPIQYVVEPVVGEPVGNEVFKQSVFVVLHNPKTNQVVTLDWGPRQKRHGGIMLIGGTVEPGETYQQAAEREIVEETGYTNFRLVKQAPFEGHGYFYSNTKHHNVANHGVGLLYELVDDARKEAQLDDGEKHKFTVKWERAERVGGLLDDYVHEVMYRSLMFDEPYTGEGRMVNSGDYDGQPSSDVGAEIVLRLSREGLSREKIQYKMRDWSVSRQRYWGAPIPIVHCASCGIVSVPDDQLPVQLPELDDFKPSGDGKSALARAHDWIATDCPKCGSAAQRETDTLDTYICSSWYMYRYLDPHNQQAIFDSKVVNKWAPIDFYNGGDHATAHLLYARFVVRFFNKIGLVKEPEPFKTMLYNGKVRASDGSPFSKSKGNGIDPLEIIEQGYGADALRTYMMFASPLELDARWSEQGVPGAYRFLSRLWTIVHEYLESDEVNLTKDEQLSIGRVVNQTIKKVTDDIEGSRYNTAIAAEMECLNDLYKAKARSFGRHNVWQDALQSLVALVAPFAPHIADELWHNLGHTPSVHHDSWPSIDKTLLHTDEATIVVQVNGKVRANVQVASGANEDEIRAAALAHPRIAKLVGSAEPKKVIVVPGRLVNFVI
jgi:leucyl-tRNA synthetase